MKLYKAITPLVIAAFLFQDVAWARPYNSLRPLPAADRTELATTIQHQATAEPSVIITPPVQFTGLKPADASGLITEISTAIHNGGFADFDTDLLTKLCAKITDRIGNLNRFQEQVQAALANKGIRVYITDDYQAPFTLVPDNEGNSVVAINAGLFRQFHSAGLAELLVAVGVFYDGMCQIVDNGPRPELPDEDANIMARIARSLLEGEPGLQVLSPENLRAVANTLSAEPAFVEFGDALTFEVLGPGSMLDKRYKIKKELGKGGFGVVYLANDEELAGMEVAVKCFRNINEMSETDRKRLERELAAMARFQNCPSIVGVRGVKRHKRTKAPLYLVMDFVPGKPLSNYVPEPGAPRTAEHLTQQEAVLAALKVARGLAVMHKAGFIHRDIKEANVMIDLDRHGSILEATILDLGLTRPIGDTTLDEAKPQSTVEHEAAQNVTDGRWVMGTPFYMSPEQEQGFTKELKPASDVYACAVMLYRMLTGERVVNPQMPGIDPELRPILRKALALAWDGQPPDYRVAAHQTEADGTTTLIRYKDAAEFGKALQAYYDRKFGNARQLKPRVAIAPKQKMGKKTAAIIAGAVAAVGAGVIGYHMLKPGESVAPVPEQPATTAAQPAVTPAPAAAGQATAETGQDGRLHYPLTRETRLGDQPISLFGTDLRLSRDGTYREPFLPDLRGIIKAIPAEPGTPGGQPHYFLMTTEPGGKYDGAAGYANRGPHNPIVLTAEELKKHQAIIVTYYARLTPRSKKAQTGFYCTAGEENLALSNVNIKESASLTADEHGYSWQRIDKVIPTSKLETLLNSSGVCRLYTVTVIAGTALPDAVHITPPILRWALQDEATGIYTVSKEETTSRAPA
ncbi:MAG: serine/threonine-protein kinase, partial [Candidatus Omnitrophica bacterium]|nr:serine/threonine-protein kinase [Candidatus Omnitrophota bacterium]